MTITMTGPQRILAGIAAAISATYSIYVFYQDERSPVPSFGLACILALISLSGAESVPYAHVRSNAVSAIRNWPWANIIKALGFIGFGLIIVVGGNIAGEMKNRELAVQADIARAKADTAYQEKVQAEVAAKLEACGRLPAPSPPKGAVTAPTSAQYLAACEALVKQERQQYSDALAEIYRRVDQDRSRRQTPSSQPLMDLANPYGEPSTDYP